MLLIAPRRLCALSLMLGLLLGCLVLPAKAAPLPEDIYDTVATISDRPVSFDRLLYYAMKEAGMQASFALQSPVSGFEMANNGDIFGVMTAHPDIELSYPNLIKLQEPCATVTLCAYMQADSGLGVTAWDDLRGLTVGVDTQRPYIATLFPAGVTITEWDTVSQVMEALAAGLCDAAVLPVYEGESLDAPPGIREAAVLLELPLNFYVNKAYKDKIPALERSFRNMRENGSAGQILANEHPLPQSQQRTVLHVLSDNTQVAREEQLITKLREAYADDPAVEWYTVELNTRRLYRDPNRLVYYANLLRQDTITRDLAAIVVSGDEAMAFLRQCYCLFFDKVPVLFYGLSREGEESLEGFGSYLGGILEKPDIYETVAEGLKLFPDTRHIFVVNDFTGEGNSYREEAKRQLAPLSESLTIEYSKNISCDAFLSYISTLPEDTLVFVGSYFTDANGQHYSLNEMKRLLEGACKAPVFSLHSTRPEYNAIGGKCLDYSAYGELLSGMLGKILGGGSIGAQDSFVDGSVYNKWVFDKSRLDVFGIRTDLLPRGTELVNRKLSIWESDPRFAVTLILLLLVVIASAAGVSLFAVRYNKQVERLQKEKAIRAVQENLEHIVNTAPLAFICSTGGVITKVNEYVAKNLGYQTGQSPDLVYEDINQRRGMLMDATRGETVENRIVKLKMPDGSAHRFLANFSASEFDKRQSLILWAMDVEERETRRDQLRVAQENLQTILELLPQAVRITDAESGAIVYANKAALDLFGYHSQEEVLGLPFLCFLPPGQEESGRDTQEGAYVEERVCRKRNGESFDALVTACMIDYNGRSASLGVIQDMTADKAKQTMLLNLAEKEKEANLLKSRFLVNMSHEIRTPMNAVIGLTEIELQHEPPGHTREVLEKISRSAKNLLNIINDILDLSKIEADKIELHEEEFLLEEVLHSALLVAAPRLDSKPVELLLNASPDLPRVLVGDQTRLWQILKNFLDNAAKFTDEGRVSLTVYPSKEVPEGESAAIVFHVEDTGIGIHDEQLEKLFIPYKQIYNEAQKRYSGTGLGMAISKQLCELMGGHLQIRSTPGKGTGIRVRIPFRLPKGGGESLLDGTALQGLRVLCADDEPCALEIMRSLLKGSAADCVAVSSGREALSLIREEGARADFGLVLLDYHLGDISGLDVARQYKRAYPELPVYIITAYRRSLPEGELEEGLVDGIFEKPLIPGVFVEKLRAIRDGTPSAKVSDDTPALSRYRDTRALICEDYPINQEVAVGMLNYLGVETLTADNGKEGLELLQRGEKVDIVFMDLQMPQMDGYEATRRIRADGRFSHLPIISLTADAMMEVADACLAAGMNDHIAKPVEFDSLQRVLDRWLPPEKRETAAVSTG